MPAFVRLSYPVAHARLCPRPISLRSHGVDGLGLDGPSSAPVEARGDVGDPVDTADDAGTNICIGMGLTMGFDEVLKVTSAEWAR